MGGVGCCSDLLRQGPQDLPEVGATCSMPSFGEGEPESQLAQFQNRHKRQKPLKSTLASHVPAQEVQHVQSIFQVGTA